MDDSDTLDTDVKFKTALMKRTTTFTKFVGMPSLSIRFWQTAEQIKAMAGLISSMEQVELTLRDARARQNRKQLLYESCGFTLRPFASRCANWKEAALVGTPENDKYQGELSEVLKELHPGVVKIEFTAFLLRGGEGENKPAAGSIHLDMFPDQTEYEKWVDAQDTGQNNDRERLKQDADAGKYELGLVLGLWKPRQTANPVHDYPMILCDASTIREEDVCAQYQRFPVKTPAGETTTVVNVAGSLKHAEAQRWFYYPEQTSDELLIFRHRTVADPYFANFHAAAKLPLPDGAVTRQSIETRAFLFFPKGWAAAQAKSGRA